jgi:hypothetical protein
MKKVIAIVAFSVVIVINVWPFYSYTDVRAKYWRCGVPLKWLTISHKDVPPEHYYFSIDYFSLLIVTLTWSASVTGIFWIIAVGPKLIRKR